MARQPKPWFRADRKVWCVTITGKRHNLGRNKKEAFKKFDALMQTPKQRQPVERNSMLAIIDKFLDWNFNHRAKATFEWYREHLRKFASAHRGLEIGILRPHHIEEWSASPNRTANSRRNMMRAVTRCFAWAMQQGFISTNPIAQLKIPNATARDFHIPSDEFEQLLKLVSDQEIAVLFRVTYETGCRPHESLLLEARHLDLENRRWVFPCSEANIKSMPRIVYLTDYAKNFSIDLAQRFPTEPLFRNSQDNAWTKSSIGCAFGRIQLKTERAEMKRLNEVIPVTAIAELATKLNPIRKSKGHEIAKTESELRCEAKRKLTFERARELGIRFSLYSLRHSWATNALKRGVDALTVAILMGYKDPSQLARTYQHLGHNPTQMLEQARKAAGG